MSLRKTIPLSVALVASALSHQATADIAPPDGYVEQCTVAKKQRSSSECVECRTMREMYANADRCTVLLNSYCFQKVCEALGGASYPEVWCRAKNASAPALPESIASQLAGSGAADLSSAPAPTNVTCATYTPPSESQNSGGCSFDPASRARGLAWLLASIAGIGLGLARLRANRRRQA
jgi:hypothetical protein